MRRPELDYLLSTMLDSQPEVSDLLFTVDKPLQVESFGELRPVVCDPSIERLTPFQTEMVALNLIGDNQWHIGDLQRRGSCDTAYTLTDKARFRHKFIPRGRNDGDKEKGWQSIVQDQLIQPFDLVGVELFTASRPVAETEDEKDGQEYGYGREQHIRAGANNLNFAGWTGL